MTVEITPESTFSVISLFAGCGGSSLGYKLSGGRVLASVEWEDHACEVYRLNHPETHLLQRDVQTVSGDELLSLTGLKAGDLDILDGSPPCQGFSTLGKRKVNDPRNRLFEAYVRLLQELQPKIFVMENVAGLVQGKMKPVFVEILKTLKASGYQVQARLMNAKFYGVPQSRSRVIFIGVRADLRVLPSFPSPQTKPIILREALAGLPDPLACLRPKGIALKLAECIKPGQDGSDLRVSFGSKSRDFSLKRLSWDAVCPTVSKTIRPGQCGLLHPDGQRYLSTAELKRVASFPDDFQFVGSLEEQWARIGNSVPPLLMKAIAGHISSQILPDVRSYEKRAQEGGENAHAA